MKNALYFLYKPYRISLLVILILSTILGAGAVPTAQAQDDDPAVVRAVLFYLPTCGHCHYVINEVLPPLFEQYGTALEIVGVDASTSGGSQLFNTAIMQYSLPGGGVPTLIIGDTYLVGSRDIPEQLPTLIEQYLAQGGIDWPDIPGLIESLPPEVIEEATPESTLEATEETDGANVSAPSEGGLLNAESTLHTEDDDILSKLKRDPEGNAVAILFLVGMIAVVGTVFWRMSRLMKAGVSLLSRDVTLNDWRHWAILALCVLGMGVSIYLAYVETSEVEAVCGPIGDCNAVQRSAYAKLFGVLPIGVLGVMGYIAMLTAWVGIRFAPETRRRLSVQALFGMALFGVLFSIYLTFLEPFVIGASCAWCLTSALSITLILVTVASAFLRPSGSPE